MTRACGSEAPLAAVVSKSWTNKLVGLVSCFVVRKKWFG